MSSTFFLGRVARCIYGPVGGVDISLHVVNVTLTNLDPLASILHFLNQYWIAASLVCSIVGKGCCGVFW
jgi:hypothetical protein